MSLWISVYCRESLGTVAAAALLRLLKERMPDWSEHFTGLRTTRTGRPYGALFHLNYRLKKSCLKVHATPATHARVLGGPPIVVDQVVDAEEVAGRVQEQVHDYLAGRKGRGAKLVREHLAGVREIYSFCLKAGHVADLYGRSLAWGAAEALALRGDGLLHEDELGWLKITPRRNELVLRD